MLSNVLKRFDANPDSEATASDRHWRMPPASCRLILLRLPVYRSPERPCLPSRMDRDPFIGFRSGLRHSRFKLNEVATSPGVSAAHFRVFPAVGGEPGFRSLLQTKRSNQRTNVKQR